MKKGKRLQEIWDKIPKDRQEEIEKRAEEALKNIDNPTRTEQIEKLRSLTDEDIDFSDIPPITEDMLNHAVIRERSFVNNAMVVTRQIPYLEKVKPTPKQRLHARIDGDVLEWFKAQGKGYQTHINAVLRAYYQNHKEQ